MITKNLQQTRQDSYNETIAKSFIIKYEEVVVPISTSVTCPISLVPDYDMFNRLACGHVFSPDSLRQFERSTSHLFCPECRTPFNRGEFVNTLLCEVQYDDLKKHITTIQSYLIEAQIYVNVQTSP
ncbi:MAG: hypothetical protein FADNKDHG_01116 [Holosporales bacterium]